jgi:hypothetical protein
MIKRNSRFGWASSAPGRASNRDLRIDEAAAQTANAQTADAQTAEEHHLSARHAGIKHAGIKHAGIKHVPFLRPVLRLSIFSWYRGSRQ